MTRSTLLIISFEEHIHVEWGPYYNFRGAGFFLALVSSMENKLEKAIGKILPVPVRDMRNAEPPMNGPDLDIGLPHGSLETHLRSKGDSTRNRNISHQASPWHISNQSNLALQIWLDIYIHCLARTELNEEFLSEFRPFFIFGAAMAKSWLLAKMRQDGCPVGFKKDVRYPYFLLFLLDKKDLVAFLHQSLPLLSFRIEKGPAPILAHH